MWSPRPSSGQAWGEYGIWISMFEKNVFHVTNEQLICSHNSQSGFGCWRPESSNPILNEPCIFFIVQQLTRPMHCGFLILRLSLLEELGHSDQFDVAIETAPLAARSNPFIQVQIARRLVEQREFGKARGLLCNGLTGLPLSHRYQDAAKLLARIDQMEKHLAVQAILTRRPKSYRCPGQPSRIQ